MAVIFSIGGSFVVSIFTAWEPGSFAKSSNAVVAQGITTDQLMIAAETSLVLQCHD